MATAMQSGENSRYTDVSDEPVDRLLSPIRGYEDKRLLPLPETIQPISEFFNDIEDYVYVALYNSQNPVDGLTQDESASIHLYTMQFHGGPSLYLLLNQSLRAKDREELKPWFSFLKLFLTALYKLPSQSERVWRGVRDVDLSSKYKKGTKLAWWGVSSCTTDIEVLESNQLMGNHGQRTLFSIDCFNGKSIANHSYFNDKEKEIILMPGSYFEVMGQLKPSSDLHIIQLKEIPPPITLVKPPFSKPTNTNPSPSSADHKRNIFAQLLSKVRSKSTTFEGSFEEIPLKSNRNCKQIGVTMAGGNGYGKKLNQLSNPRGIFIDDDQTIYIADWGNHRIMEWKLNATYGRVVAGGNGRGNQLNQLNCPADVILDQENDSLIISDRGNRRIMRWFHQNNNKNGEILISDIDCFGLIMDNNGSLYVSDYKKNEVIRWNKGEEDGTIVAGGNGQGDLFNQLNNPTFIFVDDDYSLYVSDSYNHRVMKWMKDAKVGIVVAGGNGHGNSLRQLSLPHGVVVDHFGQIYVAEWDNHRVMRWCERSEEGSIIVGGKEQGKQPNQLNYPLDLSFDGERNLYVVDCWNNRIQKFEIGLNENNLFE